MPKIIKYTLFVSLFLLFSFKEETEIEILLNILDCVEKDENVNKKQVNVMINKLYNYNPLNMNQVYEFLQDNFNAVFLCTNRLNDIPESIRKFVYPINKEFKKYNWKLYISCLNDFILREQSLKGLIELIKEKNYIDAFSEETKLLGEGSEGIVFCGGKKYEDTNLDERNICTDFDKKKIYLRDNFFPYFDDF